MSLTTQVLSQRQTIQRSQLAQSEAKANRLRNIQQQLEHEDPQFFRRLLGFRIPRASVGTQGLTYRLNTQSHDPELRLFVDKDPVCVITYRDALYVTTVTGTMADMFEKKHASNQGALYHVMQILTEHPDFIIPAT